ncbi:MAG: class I SAM-dependent methyltransferase [Verrucomicrobiales bacterium]
MKVAAGKILEVGRGRNQVLAWRLCRRFPFRYYAPYVFCKLLLDPVYREVARELYSSRHSLLDIGCGPGLLACYLRECGFSAPIHGCDYDGEKIAVAARIMKGDSATTFKLGDARKGLPSHCGDVAILDALQFCTAAEQTALLETAADRVAPGGKLIIRTCLREKNWRFRLTHVGDRFAKGTSWMAEHAVCYPSREAIAAQLQGVGLEGEVRSLSGVLPFNNFLFVFRRS